MDTQAIRAAWAEWDAASAATEAAFAGIKKAQRMPRGDFTERRKRAAFVESAETAWHATLARTDAARKAVADLPSMEEVEAYEAEQAAITAELAKQGDMFS